MESNCKFPYCLINGEYYQLEMVNDVIRFPDFEEDEENWNQLHALYWKGDISVMELFSKYARSGTSYYMVENMFRKYGINSHSCKDGDHLMMELRSGDSQVDLEYNYSKEEECILDIEYDLKNMIEEAGFSSLGTEGLINLFKENIEKLEKFK